MLFHSQTSTIQPWKFGNGWLNSSHNSSGMWLLPMLELKLIRVSKRGSRLTVVRNYHYYHCDHHHTAFSILSFFIIIIPKFHQVTSWTFPCTYSNGLLTQYNSSKFWNITFLLIWLADWKFSVVFLFHNLNNMNLINTGIFLIQTWAIVSIYNLWVIINDT